MHTIFMEECTAKESNKPINMTKGYIKELLKMLEGGKMSKGNKIRKNVLL